MTKRTRSIRVLLLCLTPITLWAFCFFLIYGAETLACVPTVAAPRTAIRVVPMVASAAIIAGAVVFAARRLRRKGDKNEAESFLAKASLDLAGLAALATVWIVLVTGMISLCAVPS